MTDPMTITLPSSPRNADVNADWMAQAQQLPIPTRRIKASERERYIPAMPLEFLRQISVAGDSVQLVLIAHMMMRMQSRREITLGPAVWSLLGTPSPRVRARLVRQLQAIPRNICHLEARSGKAYILHAGPKWPTKPMQSQVLDG